jgi:hypothetical protein
MPKRVRVQRVKWEDRPEPHTRGEAIESIQDGVTFFLKKKPIATLLVLGGTLLGFIWGGSAYLADKRDVRFEERKPLSEAVMPPASGGFFVTPLYATPIGEPTIKGDTLWVRGIAWAVVDPQLRIWKEAGRPYIVIQDQHDTLANPLFLYVEGFDDVAIHKHDQKKKK